eukprot:Skav232441  [mRNA]  locus=scaffold189:307222:308406:- [translate_table: standard]
MPPPGPPLPTGERVDEFFQAVEAGVVFPEAEIAALTPAPLLQHWKDVAATQSVAWPWVLCELSLASFLTPIARFQPLASFSLFSLTWSFFLHPGSCHTSTLLRLYRNVLHALEEKANAHRAAERQRLAAQAMPNPAAQRLLREQKKKLQPFIFRLGTGSLEGISLRITSFVGWTAACGFMVEGTQFLQWLQTEFLVNKAIATQLGANELAAHCHQPATFLQHAVPLHWRLRCISLPLGLYPFLTYDFAPDADAAAETAFMASFDERAALQEEKYLVKSRGTEAPWEAKGEAFETCNWLNLTNAWTPSAFNEWPTGIT